MENLFRPDADELVQRALADLRIGMPIAIADGETGIAAMAVEAARDRRLQEMAKLPGAVLVVSARRARVLKARVYDDDIARLKIPPGVECGWIRSIADPSTDLQYPMKGPLESGRSGEAGAFRQAVALARSARLLPAVIAVPVDDAAGLAAASQMSCVGGSQADAATATTMAIRQLVSANLPLAAAANSRVHVFRAGIDNDEHCAIEIGQPSRQRPVLTRLHSACFTGDVLGSLKCDCGTQLRCALDLIANEGSGLLLYLNQEGRGIGLVNKIRAYCLQDQGFDTVEANHRLGFEDDERDFRTGAHIIERLGYRQVQLMTNNPEKVRMLCQHGIEVVRRVPLAVGRTGFNDAYLAVKAAKSGHIL